MYHHPSCEECREGRRSIDVNHTSQLESFICSGSGSSSASGFRIPDSGSVSGFWISGFSIRPLGSSSSSLSICVAVCGGVVLASFPPSHPYVSSFHCFISVTGACNGGSWLGCGDLPAMGAVYYLGAGWPQWKPILLLKHRRTG